MQALARRDHPDQGLLRPGEFIDLAAQSGLIIERGEALLREACRPAAGRQERGRRPEATDDRERDDPGRMKRGSPVLAGPSPVSPIYPAITGS